MTVPKPDDAFLRGALTGVAGSAVVVQGWLGTQLEPMQRLYAEFGADVPALTALAISTPWRVAAPLVGLVAVVVLAVRRPRGALAYAVVAASVVLILVGTWRFAQAPLTERADLIQ